MTLDGVECVRARGGARAVPGAPRRARDRAEGPALQRRGRSAARRRASPVTRVRVRALPEAGRPPDFAVWSGVLVLEVAARPRQPRARREHAPRGDPAWRRQPVGRARSAARRSRSRGRRALRDAAAARARARRPARRAAQVRLRRRPLPGGTDRDPGAARALLRSRAAPLRRSRSRPRWRSRSGPAPRVAPPRTPRPQRPQARTRTGRGEGSAPSASAFLRSAAWRFARSPPGARSPGDVGAAGFPAATPRSSRLSKLLRARTKPRVLARALRLALEPELPGARSAAVEELRAPPGADPACERALALLARVERSRFDPDAACVSRADVVAAIEALARR